MPTTPAHELDDDLPLAVKPTPIAYDGAHDRVWSYVTDQYDTHHGDDTVVAAGSAPEQGPLLLGDLRMVLRSQDPHLGEDGRWWGYEDCLERECEDYVGHDEGGLDMNVDYPCSHLTWVPTWLENLIRQGAPTPADDTSTREVDR